MNKPLPILYTFIRCPYAMRARLTLAYAGVKYEHREVELPNKPAHLLKISPKGTVPVLLLANGKVLEQSLDIMRWALKHFDPEGWTDYPKKTLQEMDALILKNDNEFTKNLNHYKYPNRYPEDPNGAEFYRAKCEEFLQPLEQRLQNHAWLFGDKLSIADIAIFPFVRQFSMVDPEWFDRAELHKLHHWLISISDSPMFAQAMQKFSPWQQPRLLKLAAYDDPILRTPCQEVTFPLSQEDKQLIADMIYSIHPEQLLAAKAPWEAAAGMAANQWGFNKRIFLYCPTGDDDIEVVINPSYSAVIEPFLANPVHQGCEWEGCFSVPLATGNVQRELKIKAKYQNQQGEVIERELSGWFARIWQHEADHLDGYLYDDPRHGKCLEKKVFPNIEEVDKFYDKIREARRREMQQ